MAINKVILGNNTLIDLTSDTVTASTLLTGETAHAANGEQIIGTFVPQANGYIIQVNTSDEDLFGQTIIVYKDGQQITTGIFNDTGYAEINVNTIGTYILSVTYHNDSIVTTEVVVDNISVEIQPLNYKDWLIAGGLNPTDYANLNDVLADEKAVRQLMTKHASVDYLCSFT